jgi:hypothetical protein
MLSISQAVQLWLLYRVIKMKVLGTFGLSERLCIMFRFYSLGNVTP